MKRPWKKSEIVVTCLAILASIAILSAVTYSYFTAVVTGNSTATSTIVKTGTLNIDFAATEYFNNLNMQLVLDANRATEAESINFTVKNATGATVPAKYNIYLVDLLVSNNFKNADFKWELLRSGTAIAFGDFASVGSLTKMKLNSSAINLPLGQTDSLTLRIWLSDRGVDQSYLLNGNFKAKVQVEGTT